jgi:hypothetical protein
MDQSHGIITIIHYSRIKRCESQVKKKNTVTLFYPAVNHLSKTLDVDSLDSTQTGIQKARRRFQL